MNKQKSAISMIFGGFFILIYFLDLIHGNIIGLVQSYLFVGAIIAIGSWAQYKYINKVSRATLRRLYENYSFFKLVIAWLPAIFLQKTVDWVYK